MTVYLVGLSSDAFVQVLCRCAAELVDFDVNQCTPWGSEKKNLPSQFGPSRSIGSAAVHLFTSVERNHWPQQKRWERSPFAVRALMVLLSCASSAAFDCLHLFYCT